MPSFSRCPKCGHRPLPEDQALPAACPACGVILAKVAAAMREPSGTGSRRGGLTPGAGASRSTSASTAPARSGAGAAWAWLEPLLQAPERVDGTTLALRAILLLGFSLWGVALIGHDVATGEMARSFIHLPLLVFHEAGHVIFMPFGKWLSVLGGTLGQLLMPAILGIGLWRTQRDGFGAAIGLWLLGVSLLDIAPYMFDALEPQLMLLSGTTGEEGGHDWIHLFSSMGLLGKAQAIGRATHRLGALTVLVSLVLAAAVLRSHQRRWAAQQGPQRDTPPA